jgi:hypothetical protein
MARNVGPGVVVALVHSTMTAPTGPMQGVNRARMTMVIVEEDDRWAITQFHNTLVIAGPEPARCRRRRRPPARGWHAGPPPA